MVTKFIKTIETYTDSAGVEYDNPADAIRAEQIIKLRNTDIDWNNVTPEVIADNYRQVLIALSSSMEESTGN